MFYEVRVFDSTNQIKKIIQTKELSERHWMNFRQEQVKNVLPHITKGKQGILKSKHAS